jgi:hypothetical protein
MEKFKIILNYLKKNFLSIIILILASFLIISRFEEKVKAYEIITKQDTIWKEKIKIVESDPIIIEIIKQGKLDSIYKPKDIYFDLRQQYEGLVQKHTEKIIYKDRLVIDSLGYVDVYDTIYENKIKGRKFSYNLKYPEIKEIITITNSPKRQLYFGGTLQGNKLNIINQANVGLLYKNKKDQIYGVHTGMDFNGNVYYGASMYWKIKF